jgi:hypothetical protein
MEECLDSSARHRGPELRALPAAIARSARLWSVALFAPLRLCAFALSSPMLLLASCVSLLRTYRMRIGRRVEPQVPCSGSRRPGQGVLQLRQPPSEFRCQPVIS